MTYKQVSGHAGPDPNDNCLAEAARQTDQSSSRENRLMRRPVSKLLKQVLRIAAATCRIQLNTQAA